MVAWSSDIQRRWHDVVGCAHRALSAPCSDPWSRRRFPRSFTLRGGSHPGRADTPARAGRLPRRRRPAPESNDRFASRDRFRPSVTSATLTAQITRPTARSSRRQPARFFFRRRRLRPVLALRLGGGRSLTSRQLRSTTLVNLGANPVDSRTHQPDVEGGIERLTAFMRPRYLPSWIRSPIAVRSRCTARNLHHNLSANSTSCQRGGESPAYGSRSAKRALVLARRTEYGSRSRV